MPFNEMQYNKSKKLLQNMIMCVTKKSYTCFDKQLGYFMLSLKNEKLRTSLAHPNPKFMYVLRNIECELFH